AVGGGPWTAGTPSIRRLAIVLSDCDRTRGRDRGRRRPGRRGPVPDRPGGLAHHRGRGPLRLCAVPSLAPDGASAGVRHADRIAGTLRLVLLDVVGPRRRPDAGALPADVVVDRRQPGHDADRLHRIVLTLARAVGGDPAHGGTAGGHGADRRGRL